ncbi:MULTISPECIES: response regulator transcription factor [Streptomyces]|uniref:LuxR C-terminal-related transcriptional regulator n=1 Tax=Streptomyces glycanivorans TaxID=3033808 RepID=A0ABY9J676_9ACTN|nr:MULTISPECIES: helix-turn-helix transcriptional regulator [unclassified Streptomyces]WSQ76677.1 LuxR C-terminal-related transcriptional regulator [Streptomyces sp. NBC_01213]TXS18701.1 LuxR family transcriptional regulator [Streptomyces sp. wa22]WLQ63167.1 LuxR C-terminal-related transcriptional regulator [Streptomyces sp. Alt3]WSQ84005.1 LuxR C-terminal-related transcriptional regulator [Streptomyces sp. NBC_01212]WSR10044.1 LuxR C-terminal-related transcriptional regulator [Streptomyces sp
MPEPGEATELRTALLRLRRTSGLPVVFGGLLSDARHAPIAELSGAQTSALRGLVISSGSGLGGKAIALSRPCAVSDYPSSRHISHEYDTAVAAEGLRSVVAVPVVVRRTVRGVLYGALREPLTLGDRTFDLAASAARDVEQALAVRDEVQQLLAATREQVSDPGTCPGTREEDVREAHRELRALAPRIVDPVLRDELLAVCGRLASATGAAPDPAAGRVRLAPREVDVVACVASGATNAAAAGRLGLRPETVKSYLRSAMQKLGAHTRLEAVVAARRAGLLP